jgi:hypothetical protein
MVDRVNESTLDVVCGFNSHLEYVKDVIDQNKGIKCCFFFSGT